MKLFYLIPALFCCSMSSISQSAINPLGTKGALIWGDEFNYTGLPDTAKWGYEEGFIRNNEKQYYTRARSENCFVENGNLVIKSRREKFEGADYTSASINTLGKQDFSGNIRIEIKAKLPSGKGIWPALWMMGTNITGIGWPKCSEIDIMEFVGHTPREIWGTVHWWDTTSTKSTHHTSKGNKLYLDDLHTHYHVYGMERKADSIQIFVDDQYYFSFAPPATAFAGSFNTPLYLLMNTAVGGAWGGDVEDAIFPQEFYIDYVRVFELE